MMLRILTTHAVLIVAFATIAIAHAQDRPTESQNSDRLSRQLRTGQYADARRLIDSMLRDEPRDDLKNLRAMFGSGPNMRVRRGSARVPCEVTDTGVRLRLTVGRSQVDWLLDTGANVSLISDAEAIQLGLRVRDSEGRAADLAGGNTGVRVTVSRQALIGRTGLEDVLFLVTPANQMPWKELPRGKQGIIGLPLAIALDALRWTKEGVCDTGSTASSRVLVSSPPNLRYDRLHLIVALQFEGKTLEFVLDTGNQAGTQLWERFGREFEPLVKERGTKGTVRLTQVGGSSDHEVVVIPNLRLKLGDRDATLARANLFSKPVGDSRFHGLLGMDVLSQLNEVTIDFRAMTLTAR